MSPSPLLTNATLALSLIAAALLQVSLADRQATVLPGLIHLALAAGAAGLIAACGGRSRGRVSLWVVVLFALLLVAPVVSDLLSRWSVGSGDPFEVKLIYVLRNLMLGLAAFRWQHQCQSLACLTSLFLVLSAFLWTMNAATVVLLVLYAVLGMWWLMGAYWDRLSGHLADHSETAVPVRPAAAAIALALAAALLAIPLARSSRFTTALAGFMPSSGGTRWSDNQAFGGLGDGDQMVKGKEDASSFGPIESDLFLESEMPSLYDVFNELGEPAPKKNRSRKRAIPLSPSQMQQNHQHRGTTQQAGREFDAVRRRPNKIPPAGDRRSDALVHITGRAPVHLALEAYDVWDGRTLSSSKTDLRVAMKLDNLPDAAGDRWLRPSRTAPKDLFTFADYRAIRIINLRSSTIPAPPHTDAVLLDKVNHAGYFKSTRAGDVALDADFIPQLTTLHLRSRVYPSIAAPSLVQTTPFEPNERLGALAADWTAGCMPGWEQVHAICQRLRTDYELDPMAVAPEDVDDAVEHFLFEAQRGPDYLFATSAAVLLRTLGYDTRVRGGFYARASNYNVLARSTAVYKEDAHFWTEVLAKEGAWFSPDGELNSGTWLTLEPSPGFEVLCDPPSAYQLAMRAVSAAWDAVVDNPVASSLSFAAVALAIWRRATLADWAVTLWWLATSRLGGTRHTVRSTIRLVRRRAWLRGRPLKGTLGRWDLFQPGHGELKDRFSEIASWALYGDGAPEVAPPREVRRVCGRVAFKALHRPRFTSFKKQQLRTTSDS